MERVKKDLLCVKPKCVPQPYTGFREDFHRDFHSRSGALAAEVNIIAVITTEAVAVVLL